MSDEQNEGIAAEALRKAMDESADRIAKDYGPKWSYKHTAHPLSNPPVGDPIQGNKWVPADKHDEPTPAPSAGGIIPESGVTVRFTAGAGNTIDPPMGNTLLSGWNATAAIPWGTHQSAQPVAATYVGDVPWQYMPPPSPYTPPVYIQPAPVLTEDRIREIVKKCVREALDELAREFNEHPGLQSGTWRAEKASE